MSRLVPSSSPAVNGPNRGVLGVGEVSPTPTNGIERRGNDSGIGVNAKEVAKDVSSTVLGDGGKIGKNNQKSSKGGDRRTKGMKEAMKGSKKGGKVNKGKHVDVFLLKHQVAQLQRQVQILQHELRYRDRGHRGARFQNYGGRGNNSRFRQLRCYQCGRFGHVAAHCRGQGVLEVCSQCGGKGHGPKVCKRKGQQCSCCNCYGHVAAVCPRSKKIVQQQQCGEAMLEQKAAVNNGSEIIKETAVDRDDLPKESTRAERPGDINSKELQPVSSTAAQPTQQQQTSAAAVVCAAQHVEGMSVSESGGGVSVEKTKGPAESAEKQQSSGEGAEGSAVHVVPQPISEPNGGATSGEQVGGSLTSWARGDVVATSSPPAAPGVSADDIFSPSELERMRLFVEQCRRLSLIHI